MKNKTRLHQTHTITLLASILLMLNIVSRISAVREITYSYFLNAVFPQACSGGILSYQCGSIPDALAHINQNVHFIREYTIVTIRLRVQHLKNCFPPPLIQNDYVSFKIVLENGNSLKDKGVIACEKTAYIFPDSPNIISLEAKAISFNLAKIKFSHSPSALIENCTFGSSSSLIFGSFTSEEKTDPQKDRTTNIFMLYNVVQSTPNLIKISQYDIISISSVTFDRILFPYVECLIANSRVLSIKNTELRFILYVEMVDDVRLQNVLTLDNTFIGITQSEKVFLENVVSDRDFALIPYPLFMISYSSQATIKNCVVTIDSTWLESVSVMSLSIENVTLSSSLSETSLIVISSVKSLAISNCYFHDIVGACLQLHNIFDFKITNTNFTNVESGAVSGAINYSDSSISNLKPFSGTQLHLISETNFKNCKGGAISFFTDRKVLINDCNFLNNTAVEGGAIFFQQPFVKSFLEVKNSRFISNGSPKTYGGAAYIIGGATFTNNIFEGNTAQRGGVVFVAEGSTLSSVTFVDSNLFINNSASLGSIGYTESGYSKSLTKSIGKNFTFFENDEVSSPSFSLEYSVTEASSGKKIEQNEVISQYLGQTLVVDIIPFDIYGKPVKETKSLLTLSIDNANYLLKIGPRDSNITTRLEFTLFSHENIKSLGKINITLEYEKAKAHIQIEIADCPSLYIFDAAGCVSIWYWIPIAAVLAPCIVGTTVIAVIFIFFARYKSQLLKKRKRADKEMERVLLDKRIIFENEESPRTPNSSNSFIISTDDIKIIKKIGEGGQGTVYQAKWNGRDVAIKSIKKDNIDDDDEFEKEATLLMSLSHPNIVTLFGFCVPNPNQKYMVIEFMKGGSLDKLITECKVGKKSLPLKEKLNILVEICRGMNYLHTLKPNIISHRDLKPQNILLDENKSVKICDFGLSRLVGTNTVQTTMTLNIGTLLYCPPENFIDSRPSYDFVGNMSGFSYESFAANSLQSEGSISSSLSRDDRLKNASKFDVYSFGIIMWSLFFEEDPYTVFNHKKMNFFIETEEGSAFNVISSIVKGRRPTIPFTNDAQLEHWSREFIQPNEKRKLDEFSLQGIINYMNLMQKCWHQIPQERPNFEAILCDLYEIMHLCGSPMLV